MSRLALLTCACFVLLMTAVCPARAATEFDTLLAQLQPAGHVTDRAQLLSVVQQQQLERLLAELRQKTGAQVAVVTLQSLAGGEVNDFANRLFEKWGIGEKGKNNGLLFLIAVQDRKMRVEVGYGLEDILPDAAAGRILDQHVVPHFRAGRSADGIIEGTTVLAQRIAAGRGVALAPGVQPIRPPPPTTRFFPGLILGLIFAIWLASTFFGVKRRRRHGMGPITWGGFGGGYGGGWRGSGGSFGGGGGFGGFGGGMSGGGGASRGW